MVGEKIVVQICGEWFPARFMASFFFLEVARVALAESNHEALDGLSDDLQVPFRCIGRRFSKGQMCRIYRGQDGWVNARIEEDAFLCGGPIEKILAIHHPPFQS